jgi:N-acetylneuraminate synthase
VKVARDAGCANIILLHCVSGYPAPPEDYNLTTIPDMTRRFNTLTGLSDHTLGTAVSVAAVALGACVIEKHFTLSRADGGPDAAFSLEQGELAVLVRDCRAAWDALGTAGYTRKKSEQQNMIFRRSLYVVEDITAGQEFTEHNVRSIRPGYGLAPKHLRDILGRRAVQSLKRGTALKFDCVDRRDDK